MQPEIKIPTVAELGEEPFLPYDLLPLASINRRPYIRLPGMDPEWVGLQAMDLCSSRTLVRLIQDRAAELGLDPAADPAGLPQRLNTLLEAPVPGEVRAPLRVRQGRAAEEVADEHGRRLGYLLASIMLAEGGITDPLAPWEAAYLQHWRNEVREVCLGGGLANGRLGAYIATAAGQVLAICGLGDRRVTAAAHPSFLALIGAARSVRAGAGDWQAAVVADFGGTRAKRGVAYYTPQGALQRLRILPPVTIAGLTLEGKTAELAEEMIAVLAETIRQAGPSVTLAPEVICSVAAYVRNGQPIQVAGRNMGIYSWLHQLASGTPSVTPAGVARPAARPGSLTGWFSERLSASCARDVQVQFAHDGDAAAHALVGHPFGCGKAGRPMAAAVMLGTALGVGFVPPAGECRALAADFTIEESA